MFDNGKEKGSLLFRIFRVFGKDTVNYACPVSTTLVGSSFLFFILSIHIFYPVSSPVTTCPDFYYYNIHKIFVIHQNQKSQLAAQCVTFIYPCVIDWSVNLLIPIQTLKLQLLLTNNNNNQKFQLKKQVEKLF